MTLPKFFKHSTLFVSIIIGTVFPEDMVRRHDKADAEYLKLGAQFEAVGKVAEKAGDGTLVRSNWVLTAAHVAEGVYRRDGEGYKVYLEGYPSGITVQDIYIHPDFHSAPGHDIALLKLSQHVNSITPLALNSQKDEKGKEIVIVGHGDFKNGNETKWNMDGKKRAATNIIDRTNPYTINYRFDKPGTPGVTELEGTAGRGDSGGPALIKRNGSWEVAGVSSAGEPGENGPGTYGAIEHYTRVSTHIDWLQNVIEGKVAPTRMDAKIQSDGQQFVVTKGSGDGMPPVMDGLGLILGQDEDRIMIDGKIDELVPKAFNHIVFGGNAWIVSLNGQKMNDIPSFKKAFKAINKGEEYAIVFSISGEIKSFKQIR